MTLMGCLQADLSPGHWPWIFSPESRKDYCAVCECFQIVFQAQSLRDAPYGSSADGQLEFMQDKLVLVRSGSRVGWSTEESQAGAGHRFSIYSEYIAGNKTVMSIDLTAR
ncbi:hypothetical protein WJX77_009061 [Trebouxia sp. C0004]